LKVLPDDAELIACKVLIDAKQSLPDDLSVLDSGNVSVRVLALQAPDDGPFKPSGDHVPGDMEADLREVLSETDMAIICAGLGGQVGSSISRTLVRWIAAAYPGIAIVSNLSLPFAQEGKKRGEVAHQALLEISQRCLSSNCIRLDRFACNFPGMSVLELFRIVDAAWIGHMTDCHRLLCRQPWLSQERTMLPGAPTGFA